MRPGLLPRVVNNYNHQVAAGRAAVRDRVRTSFGIKGGIAGGSCSGEQLKRAGGQLNGRVSIRTLEY